MAPTAYNGVDTFFLDKAPVWAQRWKTLIEESDTQTSARAYEAATAWVVRQGLRNGSLYSKYGFEYADPASHWMPPDIWKTRRSGYQLERTYPTDHLDGPILLLRLNGRFAVCNLGIGRASC